MYVSALLVACSRFGFIGGPSAAKAGSPVAFTARLEGVPLQSSFFNRGSSGISFFAALKGRGFPAAPHLLNLSMGFSP
jgi:hypothetical protein